MTGFHEIMQAPHSHFVAAPNLECTYFVVQNHSSSKQQDEGIWRSVCLLFSRTKKRSQALVAHAYNPSYSGGKDQEDPVWANSPGDSVSKKLITKKELVEWLEV
jgi:hypothetical protein